MDFENEIRERLTAAEQSVKSAHHRLDIQDKLIESVQSLTGQVITLASEVKSMRADVNSLTVKVNEIESLPAKKYSLIAKTILTTLIGAITGYISGRIMK